MPTAPSIFDYFAEVTDPRIDRTKRHRLLDIITIIGADQWSPGATTSQYRLLQGVQSPQLRVGRNRILDAFLELRVLPEKVALEKDFNSFVMKLMSYRCDYDTRQFTISSFRHTAFEIE